MVFQIFSFHFSLLCINAFYVSQGLHTVETLEKQTILLSVMQIASAAFQKSHLIVEEKKKQLKKF